MPSFFSKPCKSSDGKSPSSVRVQVGLPRRLVVVVVVLIVVKGVLVHPRRVARANGRRPGTDDPRGNGRRPRHRPARRRRVRGQRRRERGGRHRRPRPHPGALEAVSSFTSYRATDYICVVIAQEPVPKSYPFCHRVPVQAEPPLIPLKVKPPCLILFNIVDGREGVDP